MLVIKNATMFSILYECDWNTVCCKNFIIIYSLVYRLAYHEMIVLQRQNIKDEWREVEKQNDYNGISRMEEGSNNNKRERIRNKNIGSILFVFREIEQNLSISHTVLNYKIREKK